MHTMDAGPAIQEGPPDAWTTVEVARRMGLAVRSVQLMVDRGELEAWRTPGGHRRIHRQSVERWLARHQPGLASQASAGPMPTGSGARGTAQVGAPLDVTLDAHLDASSASRPRVLLIEDSRHFQNLVSLLLRSRFPGVDLHVADDGIAGLVMAGRLAPQVLLVDILLPGIDGAALITGLRSHGLFAGSQLVVVTSLSAEALAPYAFALQGLVVLDKSRLALELPALLGRLLPALEQRA